MADKNKKRDKRTKHLKDQLISPQVAFKLTKADYAILEEYCDDEDVTFAQVCRNLVLNLLKREGYK